MIKGLKRKTFYATFFNSKIEKYQDSSRSVILNKINTYFDPKKNPNDRNLFSDPQKINKNYFVRNVDQREREREREREKQRERERIEQIFFLMD